MAAKVTWAVSVKTHQGSGSSWVGCYKCPAGRGGLASVVASLAGRKAVQKALECSVAGDDAHLLGDVWCGDGACCLVA